MRLFTKVGRHPIPLDFAQYPAGEWRLSPLESSASLVLEASGLEPDFWPKAALLARACVAASARLSLALPYLPAAREDHQHHFGARAYAQLLNTLNFAVHVFDSHSSVMPNMLNYCVVHAPTDAVVASVSGVGGVLCPDAGAFRRATAVAERLGVPLVVASKVRNPATGKLSDFSCPALPEIDGSWLVVDDICDGGGTFVGLAKASGLPREKLQLWVSHAIFSGNARKLTDFYRTITTTNSFVSLTDVPCTRVPVHAFMKGLYDF